MGFRECCRVTKTGRCELVITSNLIEYSVVLVLLLKMKELAEKDHEDGYRSSKITDESQQERRWQKREGGVEAEEGGKARLEVKGGRRMG